MKSISQQRGATLFTAMVILILLTLLALSVAQVTGLQERMAGLYRTDQQAFQTAEQVRSQLELSLLGQPEACDDGYKITLPADWLDDSADSGERLENLSFPDGSRAKIAALVGSAKAGGDRTPGTLNCLVFRLSALRGDVPTDPTSKSLVQSYFVP